MEAKAERRVKTETLQNPRKRLGRLARLAIKGGMALSSLLLLQSDVHSSDETLMRHPDKPAATSDSLTVMTANVHSWKGPNGKDNFNAFVKTLEREEVDVACVQELLRGKGRLSRLYDEGYDVYFAKTVHWPWSNQFGNAIISKVPLHKADVLSLPNSGAKTPRNAVMGRLAVGDGSLTITNTHLSTDDDEAYTQTASLADYVEGRADILCGDFNQTPSTITNGPLGSMSGHFLSATSRMNTFPASPHRKPDREIDHIFSDCGVLIPGSEKRQDIQSDHYARIQQLEITGCVNK